MVTINVTEPSIKLNKFSLKRAKSPVKLINLKLLYSQNLSLEVLRMRNPVKLVRMLYSL